MKRTLVIPVISVPVVLFLLSRMTSFFSAVWGIGFPVAAQRAAFIIVLALLFIFRKQAYSFLEESAYGFGGIAITLYLLSFFACYKYRGVVLNGCARQSLDCVIGGGILLGLFVLLFMKGADSLLQKLKNPGRGCLIFFVIAAALLNLQAVLYCTVMKEIFVWDNAGYFVTVHRLNDIFPSMEYFKAVYESIFETDYNYIIALPASIFCKVFGESRLVFVLSIVNFYLLPLVMLIYAAAKRLFKNGVGAIFAVLALPYLVFAADTGFIDIGGVFFALLATIIFLWGDGEEMCVLSGILLALCVLLRRWYSFYALSFIITAVVWGISRKKIKGSVYLILSFAFVLLFFVQPFVSGKLMADYRDMYSAYALGLGTDMRIFTRYFGIVMPVAVSAWAIFRQIKSGFRMTPEFFMWVQGIICFVLFAALQTHGQQHLALYAPMFILIILSACNGDVPVFATFLPAQGDVAQGDGSLVSKRQKNMTKKDRPLLSLLSLSPLLSLLSLLSLLHKRTVPLCRMCVVLGLCLISTVSVFVPREQPRAISEIEGISVLPSFSMYPPIDENAESFLQITEFMDGEIGMKGKTVCFLASSLEMNYDTLRNAEISLSVKKKHDIDRESYYLTISDVDKRDGLSRSLFAADYILVPSQLQIHLAPEEQRVISVPYNHIINGTEIGKAYEKQEKTFTLSSGDKIFLYKKLRDITPGEEEKLKNEIFN